VIGLALSSQILTKSQTYELTGHDPVSTSGRVDEWSAADGARGLAVGNRGRMAGNFGTPACFNVVSRLLVSLRLQVFVYR